MGTVVYKSLPEKTAELISDTLYLQNYHVGAKLPNEFEMAQKYGVSRNTVREAIRILVSRGVLEVHRGSGTYVSSSMGISDDPLRLSMIEDKKKLMMDMIDVRLMIEPNLASLAAENATPAEIRQMSDICSRTEKAVLAGEHYLEEDMEFHTFVAGCSHNLMIHNLYAAINQAIMLEEKMISMRLRNITAAYHRRIFESIRDHKPSEARYAMTAHLLQNRERVSALRESSDGLQGRK